MWNKRRDEEPPKPFSPQVSQSISPVPASAPRSGNAFRGSQKGDHTCVEKLTPYRDFEPANNANSIGKSVKVKGDIYSKEDLFVDGTVEGTLEASENKITIGPHGTIQATLKAREVLVLGNHPGGRRGHRASGDSQGRQVAGQHPHRSHRD